MEHYYRATDRAFLKAEEWAALPKTIRPCLSSSALKTIINDAASALLAGTFDKRTDRHLSWTPMILDEDGWEELKGTLEQALESALEIQAKSAARLTKADEAGIPVSVAMLGFEAPSSGDGKVTPSKKKKKKG